MAGLSPEKARVSKMIRFERGLPLYPCLCGTTHSRSWWGATRYNGPIDPISESDGDRGPRGDFAAAVPVWQGTRAGGYSSTGTEYNISVN